MAAGARSRLWLLGLQRQRAAWRGVRVRWHLKRCGTGVVMRQQRTGDETTTAARLRCVLEVERHCSRVEQGTPFGCWLRGCWRRVNISATEEGEPLSSGGGLTSQHNVVLRCASRTMPCKRAAWKAEGFPFGSRACGLQQMRRACFGTDKTSWRLLSRGFLPAAPSLRALLCTDLRTGACLPSLATLAGVN